MLADVARERVLVVEDDAAHAALIEDVVRSVGAEVDRVSAGAAACERLLQRRYQLMILDVGLPDMSGFEVQRWAAGRVGMPPILFVTADEEVDHAVGAMRSGASHYVVKRRNYLREVESTVRVLLGAEVSSIAVNARGCDSIVGRSPEIGVIHRRIREAAAARAPVLICGETGSGKELIARAIHDTSTLSGGPFVAVNCSSLSQNMVDQWAISSDESAASDNRDPIRLADFGTLFLDGVGDLPRGLQAGLLRLVEGGRARGGGSSGSRGPRIIASSQADLDRKTAVGEFRLDLYHRLNGLRIDVPPLRNRRSDIPLLAEHFVRRHAPPGVGITLSREAMRQLIAARWLGNVRELERVIQRTLAGWAGGKIYRCDMGTLRVASTEEPTDDVTREELVALLMQYRGRLKPVAEVLGISVRTVQRRMVDFELRLRDLTEASRQAKEDSD